MRCLLSGKSKPADLTPPGHRGEGHCVGTGYALPGSSGRDSDSGSEDPLSGQWEAYEVMVTQGLLPEARYHQRLCFMKKSGASFTISALSSFSEWVRVNQNPVVVN
jgi:hypothetical protein